MSRVIEFNMPNGQKVAIYEEDFLGRTETWIEVDNERGYTVSGRKMSNEEKEKLESIIK